MRGVGIGEATIVVLVLLCLGLAVAAIIRGIRTEITWVADELTTTLSMAEVESRVSTLLTNTRRVTRRKVLPGTYTLSYRHYPAVAILLALLTFPLGPLLLLLLRNTYQLVISITDDGDRTRVRVVGRIHRRFATSVRENLRRRLTVVSTTV
jgi:hypothetical protein